MSFLEIALIAVGLAMDAFAVSLVAGASGHAKALRPAFRLSIHFGLFQFLMPIVGWIVGMSIASYISSVDHWIALSLLAFVGIRMIQSGMNPEEKHLRDDPTQGFTLIMLSIATSIDALAVGLSLAMLEVNIWYASVVIGIITAVLSLTGTRLGDQLGSRFGQRMEIVGGMILIAIGLRILVSHLLA